MSWSDGQLKSIDAGDDFTVAPYRPDGVTPGTSTWVWVVVVDDGAFVRTANPSSRWFAAALAQRGGVVESGGVRHRVRFEHVADDVLRERVDEAFARKYGADPYFSPDLLVRSRDRIARITPLAADERTTA